ncbi:MAG: VCBS repeat-containing protein [Thermoplasmata archaeon]|nr:MAG: VCBS repeat-containing protein [Thermoplasmata archaeon]
MNTGKLFPLFMAALFITINFTLIIPDTSEGSVLTKFSNGMTGKDITFESAGNDYTLAVRLKGGVAIRSAHLNITGLPEGSKYPLNPKLYVGADEDLVWGFNETGYGRMGHQTELYNDAVSHSFTIKSHTGGSNAGAQILLPQGAEVSSATLRLNGEITDFGTKTIIENNKDRVSDMDIGDIDNDGDMDIVISVLGDYDVIWYENVDGKGTNWNPTTVDGNLRWATDVCLADVTGEGNLDIIASTYWDNILAWYNNTDGSGTFSTRKTIDNTANFRFTGIAAGDLNNDSAVDIVCTLGYTNGRVVWYNNTAGNGTNWARKNIDGTETYAEDVCIVDLDDDGDNDTVIVNYNRNDVKWYENQGNASSWSAEKLLSNNGLTNGVSVVCADIDEDNNIDVVGLGNSLRWFEAPDDPSNSWTGHTITSPGANSYLGEVVVADLGIYGSPPDGHLDIAMVTAYSNDVRWYENNPSNPGSSFTGHTIRGDHNYARCLRAVDLGGDFSYPDLIVSAYTSTTDDVVWYELNKTFPKNVRVDVGNDGDTEYNAGASWLNTTKTTGNFAVELNQLLDAGPASTVVYGHKIVTVPFKVSTDTAGEITVDNIDIKYEYTAKADRINSGSTLADVLQKYVGPIGSGGDYVTILLKFSVESAGKLRISDLYVEYNDYPSTKGPIPSNASLEEDTKSDKLVDLSLYFQDDYLASNELTYNIISYTNNSIVNAYITDSHFIGIDSESGSTNDNWYGSTELSVQAVDEDGLMVVSNIFRINITPVNDEPLKGPDDLPPITLKEGSVSNSLFLVGSSQYFVDLELDDLYFEAELDPENVYDNESLVLHLDENTWELIVEGLGDWYGKNVPLRVYCDDDPDVDKTIYKDTYVSVSNVNDDAPYWKPLPTKTIKEGTKVHQNLLYLPDYVEDIDDTLDKLSFKIIETSNSTAARVELDTQAYVDVTLLDDDFFGEISVSLRATDSGGNHGDGIFTIIVEPVNDPPDILLITPEQDVTVLTDSVVLKWQGSDVDNPTDDITYTLQFDQVNAETVVSEAQDIKDTSFRVEGLENGYTYFWRVVGYDGIDEGSSDIFSFFVQYGEVPQTTLGKPLDKSILNSTSVTLDWSYSYSGTEDFTPTYDLYFQKAGNGNNTNNGDGSDLTASLENIFATSLTSTEYTIDNLTDGATYYWTVIPQFSGGEGVCTSGVWSFSIDLSCKCYGFTMELVGKSEIKVEQGKQIGVQIKLTNLGANNDIFTIQASSTLHSSLVSIPDLDDNDQITLIPGETKIIDITIDATNAPVTQTEIDIDAVSLGDGSSQSLTIDLTIEKSKGDGESSETERFGINNTALLAIIIVIIIVIILAVLFVLKRRKKEEDEDKDIEPVEEVAPGEFAKRAPEVYDAELVSGPMTISDVVKGQTFDAGAPLPPPDMPVSGIPEEPRSLPAPEPEDKRVRKKKKVKKIGEVPTEEDQFMVAPGEVQKEEPLDVPEGKAGPEVMLPTFDKDEEEELKIPREEEEEAEAAPDIDLTFKHPGKVKKARTRTPSIFEEEEFAAAPPPEEEPLEVPEEELEDTFEAPRKRKEKKGKVRGPKVKLPGE